MKTSSLKKAIEKEGFTVNITFDYFTDCLTGQKTASRNEYFSKGNKYKVHWYDQDGEAVCVQVQKINDRNDSQIDYFPGYFAHTIKEVIGDLKRE